MKKFNWLMILVMSVYTAAAVAFCLISTGTEQTADREYKVEINRILYDMEESGCFNGEKEEWEAYKQGLNFDGMTYVKNLEFLTLEESAEERASLDFYNGYQAGDNQNGDGQENSGIFEGELLCSEVRPIVIEGTVRGYVRFDYESGNQAGKNLKTMACFFTGLGAGIFLLLFYIRNRIIRPFTRLSEMPLELSKGHLKGELEESKNRYFGHFLWGISMLRDTLNAVKKKELRLEKEKKLLLLSISHDIKTPLNAIKLYAKAMEEDLYDTKEKQNEAAVQIRKHADEIEDFVKEIVKSSSEDILSIEVRNTEFYLKELVDMIRKTYEPKCRLKLVDFEISEYENKLMKGDIDRAVETVENIMENAFKYGDGKRIAIDFYEEEYCQLVRITNTGAGVKKEEQVHLFDSFYRGSNVKDREGSGLGLYICKEIMKKMDGDIFVEQGDGEISFVLVFRE